MQFPRKQTCNNVCIRIDALISHRDWPTSLISLIDSQNIITTFVYAHKLTSPHCSQTSGYCLPKAYAALRLYARTRTCEAHSITEAAIRTSGGGVDVIHEKFAARKATHHFHVTCLTLNRLTTTDAANEVDDTAAQTRRRPAQVLEAYQHKCWKRTSSSCRNQFCWRVVWLLHRHWHHGGDILLKHAHAAPPVLREELAHQSKCVSHPSLLHVLNHHVGHAATSMVADGFEHRDAILTDVDDINVAVGVGLRPNLQRDPRITEGAVRRAPSSNSNCHRQLVTQTRLAHVRTTHA